MNYDVHVKIGDVVAAAHAYALQDPTVSYTERHNNQARAIQALHAVVEHEVTLLEWRIEELLDAIRQHRDERGHGRCWLDDLQLYSVLPEAVNEAEFVLPPREEFLRCCAEYWTNRQPLDKPSGIE